jgi:anti-sigma factor ChrR (cupin superfamily)
MQNSPSQIRLDLFGQDWAEEGLWEPYRPGVEIRRLYQSDGGPAAALLRYEPGASIPYHEHTGYEHILVLQGAQRDERGLYPAGTLVVNPPGSAHAVNSDSGCIVLVIWERAVRFIPRPLE